MSEEEGLLAYRALRKAGKAFRESLEDSDYDPSYWSLRLVARKLSTDFASVLETLIVDDLQVDIGKVVVD